MGIADLRVLGWSLGGGAVLGGAGGLLWALLTERSLVYGIATGFFLVGIVALALGLMAATEPPEGWSLRRSHPRRRRSVAARVAGDAGTIEKVTALGLVVWALVVGGGLVATSLLLFAVVT